MVRSENTQSPSFSISLIVAKINSKQALKHYMLTSLRRLMGGCVGSENSAASLAIPERRPSESAWKQCMSVCLFDGDEKKD